VSSIIPNWRPAPARAALICFALLSVSAFAQAGAGADLPAFLARLSTATAAATGLCLVLFVPGLLFVPIWVRRGWVPERGGPFYSLLAAGLTTVACHAITHKVVVLSGYLAEYWSMWGGAVAFAVVGALASAKWGGEPVGLGSDHSLPTEGRGAGWTVMAGGGALLAFVLLVSPPRFVEETNYWPDKVYADLSKLNFGHTDLAAAGIKVSYGPAWTAKGDGVYDLAGKVGRLHLVNRGATSYPLDLKFVLQNRWDLGLLCEITLDDEPIGEEALFSYVRGRFKRSMTAPSDGVYLTPPFDHKLDPRDRPMYLCLVAPTVFLPPGTHELCARLTPVQPCRNHGPRLTLYDLSSLDGAAFGQKLARHFFIGDTGDLYETLDFSRNFREHWIQHSSSYDGRRPDGGGATSISDEPPGHHFLCFLALTFVRDSITSISLLYLAELLLLFGLVVDLAASDNESFRWWHTLPILGVFCAYSKLCRLGLESNAPDTLFLLVWLCAVKAYLDGQRGLASWLVGIDFLIHIPTPQSMVILGVASWLATRDRAAIKFIGRTFMVLVLIAVLRVLIISMDAGLRGALVSGQAPFGGTQRMGLLREIVLRQRWGMLAAWAIVARDFARLVLIASCGAIPIFAAALFAKVRRPAAGLDVRTAVLFMFGLLYYLAMSLIDFQRGHHVGPIAFPLMAATVRRLSRIESPAVRRGLFAATCAACVTAVVFLLIAGPDYTGTFTRFPLYALSHPSNRRGYGFHPF